MRIAFLCKRRYTGKDVISDRFGRLYEIPRQLAALGHSVRGFCLDYHVAGHGEWEHQALPGELAWESSSIRPLRGAMLARYPRKLISRVAEFCPDLVIGASDMPHAILAAAVARKLQLPLAVDLYDNFESFGQARIPGLTTAFGRALRRAALVVAVSKPLAELVAKRYRIPRRVSVMPNGVDGTLFTVRDRMWARESLGLPLDAKLIGTAGGLAANKGVAQLYAAWDLIASQRDDTYLVLAGPVDPGLALPHHSRVRYLGNVDQPYVAVMFNALDVGVITLLDSPFGRFCFPQKAQEMVACGLPIVASNVGVMATMLADHAELLFAADDPSSLAACVLRQIDRQVQPAIPIGEWSSLVLALEAELQQAASA
jgi:glycosyltransferase involved in cell wall biosynthesis